MQLTRQEVVMVHPELCDDDRLNIPAVFRLSEADQPLSIRNAVPALYFFRQGATQEQIRALRRSLGRALGAFYPLAGRLVDRPDSPGRVDVSCRSLEVPFWEARADTQLDDYAPDFQPHPHFRLLVPPSAADGAETRCLQLQLTHFQCGGMCLCIQPHHSLCDGPSFGTFMKAWVGLLADAEATNDLIRPYKDFFPLDDLAHRNISDHVAPDDQQRSAVLNGGADVLIMQDHNYPQFRLTGDQGAAVQETCNSASCEIADKIFHFTPQFVEALKKETNATSFQSISAYLWQKVTLARGIPPGEDVLLCVPVDGRRRLNPPLPPTYMGNVIFHTYAQTKSGELVGKPLSYAATLIRDAISKISNSYIVSLLGWMRQQSPPVSHRIGSSSNLNVGTWVGLSFCDLEFPWGKPSCLRVPPLPPGAGDGLIILLPSSRGEGHIEAMVALNAMHMPKLQSLIVD